MPSDYDFWLFDLDGTLVDVEPTYPRRVLTRVGDRLGVGFDDREVAVLWYGLGGARDRFLREREIDPERFWQVFHDEEEPRARAEATFIYEDAERFLLERDAPVGLVTHCQEYLTDPVLDYHSIGDLFETVVCCDDDVGWKPDPDPVHRAMREMGVAHNGHVGALAGDDPDDIGAARNAGLDGIHVKRRLDEAYGRCVWGDRRVTTLTDLL